MAKYGSSAFSVLLADGYDILGAKLKGFSYKPFESVTEPSHGLGDSSESHSPVGVQRATITQEGAFFDDAINGMHLAWRASSVAVRIMSWAPFGNTIGQAFAGCASGFKVFYEVLDQLQLLTKANVTYLISGLIDEGVIVQSSTAKTVDWNTKTDGNSVDYASFPQRVIPITSASKAAAAVVTTTVAHGLTTGDLILISGNTLAGPSINSELAVTVLSTTTFSVAVNTAGSSGAGTGGTFVRTNTSGGAAGYQQVSAFSGFSAFVGKIRGSADDSTYADLITFSNVTSAPNAQRVEVAGVIPRYLSYDGNVTGAGSITPFVGLVRL